MPSWSCRQRPWPRPSRRVETEPTTRTHPPTVRFEARSRHWQPSDAIIDLLVMTQGIPPQFCRLTQSHFLPQRAAEMSRPNFGRHALARWRAQQGLTTAFEISAPPPFGKDWRPNQDAFEILEQAGIDRGICRLCKRGIRVCIGESGAAPQKKSIPDLSNTSAVAGYVILARYSTAPSPPVYRDTGNPTWRSMTPLRLAGISKQIAKALLPEFVMYWLDSNEVHTSWNSKFLQHVKRQTQGANYGDPNGGAKGRGGAGASHRSKDRSLNDDLTDTSWAN